jgi:hypothetical protein
MISITIFVAGAMITYALIRIAVALDNITDRL